MKIKLAHIIVFCLFAMLCQAQMTDNVVWTEYNIQDNAITSKQQYWTSNDTIIEDKTYAKVVDTDR